MSWTTATLCTDADLKAYERQMPELAQKFSDGATSPTTAYSNKRTLAKRDIWLRLLRLGIDPDALTADELTYLNKAAVFKELNLIFMDMAGKNETVMAEKAKTYLLQYEDCWTDIKLALVDDATPTPLNIPLGRA